MRPANSSAFSDVSAGIKQFNFAYMLALEDLRDRYQRSYLGAGWIVAGFLAFIGVKAAIFVELFTIPGYDYFSHLTIGFALWMLISNSVTSSVNLYVARRNWILSAPIPYSVYALALVCTIMIEFLLVGGAAVILVGLFGDLHPVGLIAVFPAVFVYAVVTFFLALLLAPLGARFRDFIHFTQTLIRLMFFATPILWIAEPGTLRGAVAAINPFSYYIELLRAPLMSGSVDLLALVIVPAISVSIITGGWLCLALTKKWVPLWL